MKAKLHQLWQQLTDSLWFIPGLMIVSAMALGLGLVELEVYYPIRGSTEYPLLFGVGAEGSRSMLSAIASSMLTVAGLSFTLTLSAISQVSGQYSPRLLRNFMKDRINQFVMGYFTGSFAYCLIVLRTIRGSDELTFVPSIAVLTGLLLALGGVLALILFIHHIAESMQISTIIYKIMDETTAAIDRLFPQELGEPAYADVLVDKAKRLIDEPKGWITVPASRSGYLQQIHSELLLDWAVDHQMLVRLEYAIGDFVGKGFLLLSVRPVNEQQDAIVLTSNESEALQDCLQLGRYRAVEQDVRFGIQQLVDIITGALTPSTNDTTTAIMAIDHLCVIISRLAARPFPSPFRAEDNQLYVITRSASFAQMMTDAFDPVRISGKANHAIFVTLLRVYERLTAHTHDTARLSIIKQQIKLVREASDTTLETSYEKELVNAL